MYRSVSALVVLSVFWLLLSGHYTTFLIGAGVLSALGVLLFSRRMDLIDHEGHPLQLGLRVLGYWSWLAKEIFKSALAVSRIILDPKLPVSPTLVRFRPSQRSSVGLVIHANSITLTPGTISIEVGRDEFLVHALTRTGAAGTVDSEMDRRITALEGEAP